MKFVETIPYLKSGKVVMVACPVDWKGVQIRNQREADLLIPTLLRCPAAVRFLSCEPLLGPIDLTRSGYDGRYVTNPLTGDVPYRPELPAGPRISWVIVGAESGPRRRPMDAAWARDLLRQCRGARVSYFLKQMEVGGKVSTDVNTFPRDLWIQEFPERRTAEARE